MSKSSTSEKSREDGSDRCLVRHAEGEQEHALCGLAFDAYDSGDEDQPVVFAEAGETVTCPDCRAAIDYVRSNFRGYRYVPNSVLNEPGSLK